MKNNNEIVDIEKKIDKPNFLSDKTTQNNQWLLGVLFSSLITLISVDKLSFFRGFIIVSIVLILDFILTTIKYLINVNKFYAEYEKQYNHFISKNDKVNIHEKQLQTQDKKINQNKKRLKKTSQDVNKLEKQFDQVFTTIEIDEK